MPPPDPEPSAAPNPKRWWLVALLAGAVVGISAVSAWFARTLWDAPPAPKLKPPPVLADGETLYQTLCISCHGPTGRGDGTAAEKMDPPPGDFTSGKWKHGCTPEDIRRVIQQGVRDTAMPSTPTLSDAELTALTDYVLTLANRRGELPAPLREKLRLAGFVPADSLRPAPPLHVRDAAGRDRSLADLRGQVVVVNFWSSTCTHCLAELPALQRLAASSRARGLAVLSICHDEPSPDRAAAIAHRHAPRLPIHVDPTGLARMRYDVAVMPSVYLVDRSGNLLGRVQGATNWDGGAVRSLLSACGAGEEER